MSRRDSYTGRMTRSTRDGQEDDQIHYSGWLPADDYAELVLAALDEGCPPEALLAEIVHAWRVAWQAEAEMGLSIAKSHGATRKP